MWRGFAVIVSLFIPLENPISLSLPLVTSMSLLVHDSYEILVVRSPECGIHWALTTSIASHVERAKVFFSNVIHHETLIHKLQRSVT